MESPHIANLGHELRPQGRPGAVQLLHNRVFRQGLSQTKHLLLKFRTQIVASAAPQLVQLEAVPVTEEVLQIQYRGAELRLPAGVDMDAVSALLRSIQSL